MPGLSAFAQALLGALGGGGMGLAQQRQQEQEEALKRGQLAVTAANAGFRPAAPGGGLGSMMSPAGSGGMGGPAPSFAVPSLAEQAGQLRLAPPPRQQPAAPTPSTALPPLSSGAPSGGMPRVNIGGQDWEYSGMTPFDRSMALVDARNRATEERQQQVLDAKTKAASHGAYGVLQKLAKAYPGNASLSSIVGDAEDPTTDYAKALPEVLADLRTQSSDARQERALTAAADRQTAALNAVAGRKNIDPLSPQGIAAKAQLWNQTKGQQQTPDQVKSNTVLSLAEPAAQGLLDYHGGQESGFQRGAAAFAGHIPGVGNALQGAIDDKYQAALDNARTLATQYLEIMPKSRFQPQSVNDIVQQIAPTVGDAAPKKAQKIARIQQLIGAIRKRAANPSDLAGPSLDDAPLPPTP